MRLDTRFAAIPERLGKRESKFVVLGSMAEAVVFGALIGFEYETRLLSQKHVKILLIYNFSA